MKCAYKYALLPPSGWDDDAERQATAMQHDLWDALLALHVRRLAAIETALRTAHPFYISAANAFAALERGADGYADSYVALKAERKTAFAAARAPIKSIDTDYYASVKAARQAANAAGLYWSNANAVMDSFEDARRRAAKSGAQLHPARREGEARLSAQIQCGMSVRDLFGGAKSQVRILRDAALPLRAGRRRKNHVQQVRLELVVHRNGDAPKYATWPIVMHRPLPDGATVKAVQVRRYRAPFDRPHAAQRNTRWQVVFVCDTQSQPPLHLRGTIAVNFGWRRTDDGLRLATISRDDAPGATFLCLPPDIERRMARLSDHQSRRAQLMVLPQRTEDDERELTLLSREMRRTFAWLERRRRDHYRVAAKTFVGDARAIIFNAHDMAETAQTSDLPRPARYYRRLVAASIFRDAVTNWARKTGAEIVEHDGAHARSGCCGAAWPNGIDRLSRQWVCPSCHRMIDQDESYCRLMLRERSDAAENAGSARADKQSTKQSLGRATRRRTQNGGTKTDDLSCSKEIIQVPEGVG